MPTDGKKSPRYPYTYAYDYIRHIAGYNVEEDIYYHAIFNPYEEVLDSCGGYYGASSALEDAKSMIDEIIQEQITRRCCRLKGLIKAKVPLIYRTLR